MKGRALELLLYRIRSGEYRPQCAKCRKPVDRIEQVATLRMVLAFYVECHGEHEQIEMPDLDAWEATKIEILPCFGTKALPGGDDVHTSVDR